MDALMARQLRIDEIDRVDDVGAGLPEDDNHDRAFSVQISARAHVLHRVDYVRDIG
jgi:hypothetical protein